MAATRVDSICQDRQWGPNSWRIALWMFAKSSGQIIGPLCNHRKIAGDEKMGPTVRTQKYLATPIYPTPRLDAGPLFFFLFFVFLSPWSAFLFMPPLRKPSGSDSQRQCPSSPSSPALMTAPSVCGSVVLHLSSLQQVSNPDAVKKEGLCLWYFVRGEPSASVNGLHCRHRSSVAVTWKKKRKKKVKHLNLGDRHVECLYKVL